MLKINMDCQNDILYIALSDMRNSYGDENDGLVTFYDLDTDVITGITIFDFLKMYNNNQIKDLQLPVNIDFNNEVYPYLRDQMMIR